jgi:anti-sigma28 factor (negative regulator of flagellin synthesis)
MRIDNKPVAPISSRPSGTDSPPAKPATEPATAATIVVLSEAASAVQRSRVESAVAARIDRIQALLARGEYPIDLDRLAERLRADDAARAGVPDAPEGGGEGTP